MNESKSGGNGQRNKVMANDATSSGVTTPSSAIPIPPAPSSSSSAPPLPPIPPSTAMLPLGLSTSTYGILPHPLLPPSAILTANLNALSGGGLLLSRPLSELRLKARLAQQTERWEEMATFMRALVFAKSAPLTAEERGLLAVAYKRQLAARRQGWRSIYAIEIKERGVRSKLLLELAKEEEREAKARANAQGKEKETEKEKERQRQMSGEMKMDAESSCSSGEGNAPTVSQPEAQSSSPAQGSQTASVLTLSPSSSTLTILRSRLSSCDDHLHHLRSYRYAIFHELVRLVDELCESILLGRCIPFLLHDGSTTLFKEEVKGIVENIVEAKMKKKRMTMRPNHNHAVSQQPDAASSSSSSSSTTPARADSASNPSSSTSSRHFSIEGEIDVQLRALDVRTRFLTCLRSGDGGSWSLVFYVKMVGDCTRLVAELLSERGEEADARIEQSIRALCYYRIATYIAIQMLTPANPIRLGLALNLAVFYCEVMAQPDRACQTAKNAYDAALAECQQTQAQGNNTSIGPPNVQRSGESSERRTPTDGTASLPPCAVTGHSTFSLNLACSHAAPGTSASSAPPCNCGLNNSSIDGYTYGSLPGCCRYSYDDSLLIMQLLKQNLALWSAAT